MRAWASIIIVVVLMVALGLSGGAVAPRRGGGGGGPGTLGSITISNVVAYANFPSGKETHISWSTSPQDATNTVQYWDLADPASLQTLAVSTAQELHIDFLKFRTEYGFFIKATKTGYNDAGYVNSFYTTDISDDVYITGTRVLTHWGMCDLDNTYRVNVHERLRTPGDVVHDYSAKNDRYHTEYYTYAHIETPGMACPNLIYNIGMRHITVRLFVSDTTDGFQSTDTWIQGHDTFPKTGTDVPVQGFVDQYLKGFRVTFGPISVSLSAGVGDCTIYDWGWGNPRMPGALQSDGSILLGYVDMEFNPCRSMALDATFVTILNDVYAQSHYLHGMVFKLELTYTLARYFCVGLCFWDFTHYYDPVYVVFGDGAGVGNQYIDLQDGTADLRGFS